MSRNGDSESIKNILNNLFQDSNLEPKFLESKIPAIWNEVVGKYISERTSKIYSKNGLLFVHITSAPLKNEMMMNREKIITLLNDELGKKVVKELIIK